MNYTYELHETEYLAEQELLAEIAYLDYMEWVGSISEE